MGTCPASNSPCASTASPSHADCCAMNPKQMRAEISSDDGGVCTAVQCIDAQQTDQASIDAVCSVCASSSGGSQPTNSSSSNAAASHPMISIFVLGLELYALSLGCRVVQDLS